MQVIEKKYDEMQNLDIYSRLLKERIVFTTGTVDEKMADRVVSQLLYLNGKNKNMPIYMLINSRGGALPSEIAMYDTMQLISAPVTTICMGWACSSAATLLAGGAPGCRFSLPNSRIMIHEPSWGFRETASELEITNKQLQFLKKQLIDILALHTKQPFKKIEKDIKNDFWMGPDEAVKYGMIDAVITKEHPIFKKFNKEKIKTKE